MVLPSQSPYRPADKRWSGDWSAHISSALDRTADIAERLTDDQWARDSLCEGWSVREVIGHLAWRVNESTPSMLGSAVGHLRSNAMKPGGYIAAQSIAYAKRPTDELIAILRRVAERKVHRLGRTNIAELAEVIVHTYDFAVPLGIEPRFDPNATGAVARMRSVTAIGTPRHVVRHRTLAATDARWTIGNGPVLEASAASILLYLFGRRGLGESSARGL